MDVTHLVEQLRTTVEQARSLPMSASAVVNRAELLEQIDALRSALEQVTAQPPSATARGGGSGGDSRGVSDSGVSSEAMRQSANMLAEMQRECEALRRDTDAYVDGRLANLEVTLTKTLEAVRRGRDRLQGRSDLDHLDQADADTSFTYPT